ncbi:hypothetical protein NDI37_11765 [Funiculus sociatus GB2-A5]|uniref:Uncharacterized protein n=1 Tax=Funiculus sociatus GB2-A5 TaxID=2933946 RepID=A0ABV0JP13_9CYAN|nr:MULTISPECIES: hypothetical protein [unclassified Trichocoleus]
MGEPIIGWNSSQGKTGKTEKTSPGEMCLPLERCQVSDPQEVHSVAEKFVLANSYNPL